MISRVSEIIIGRDEPIRLALTCLLAGGHLLIEDVPGVGKTTLAHTLARSLGLDFVRIQFTSDLLRHQIGTFPLPESQLDRFLMRIHIGYPDARSERALLKGKDRRDILRAMDPVIDPHKLIVLQQHCQQVHCSDALIDYVQALLDASRNSSDLRYGLSPRAGIALTHAARAWAYLAGRTMVLPEDIQSVAQSVLSHRLQGEDARHTPPDQLSRQLIQSVPIP